MFLGMGKGIIIMKVLFIYIVDSGDIFHKTSSNKPIYSNSEIHFGISYLSAYLKKYGHKTELFICSKKTQLNEIKSFINLTKPQMICFSLVYKEYCKTKKIAAHIKKYFPDIYLICGGVHTTLNPSEIIKEAFDAVCIGEGEFALVELANQLKRKMTPSGIPNMWLKHGNKIEKNKTQPFYEPLDNLPFPDREIWEEKIYDSATAHTVLLGRGCPFGCTYCCNHSLKNISGGQYVRMRSPENVVEEIKHIISRYEKVRVIYLEVEAINIDLAYLESLCIELRSFVKENDLNLSFGANYRIIPSQDVEYIFEVFRLSGIRYVNIGLESGCERIRREIMNRNYSNQNIMDVVKAARKNRILIRLYVMLGIPEETHEDFLKTIKIVMEINPVDVQLNIFCPYPGTKLYDYCVENGYLPKKHIDLGRAIATINYPQYSKKRIQKDFIYFYYLWWKKKKKKKPYFEYLIFKIKIFSTNFKHFLSNIFN